MRISDWISDVCSSDLHYVDSMAGSPVNPVQMSLLMRVYYLRNATMQTLAQHMETDRTTTTRNVDVLVRDGFLEIGEGKDRRQRLVRLTERGHEALEVSIPQWRKAQDELKNALGDELWNNILRDARTLIELRSEEHTSELQSLKRISYAAFRLNKK